MTGVRPVNPVNGQLPKALPPGRVSGPKPSLGPGPVPHAQPPHPPIAGTIHGRISGSMRQETAPEAAYDNFCFAIDILIIFAFLLGH